MTKRPSDESLPNLDTWAVALVTSAPDAVAEMRAIAKRQAENKRLSADDREFAKSQLTAIQRAVRRNRKSARKK